MNTEYINENFTQENLFFLLEEQLKPGDDIVLLKRIDNASRNLSNLFSLVEHEDHKFAIKKFEEIEDSLIKLNRKFNSENELNKKDAVSIIIEIISGYIESLINNPGINTSSVASFVQKFLQAFLMFKDYDMLNEYLSGTTSYRQAHSYEFILNILLLLTSSKPEKIALAKRLYDSYAFGEEPEVVDQEVDVDEMIHFRNLAQRGYSEKEIEEKMAEYRERHRVRTSNALSSTQYDSSATEAPTAVF